MSNTPADYLDEWRGVKRRTNRLLEPGALAKLQDILLLSSKDRATLLVRNSLQTRASIRAKLRLVTTPYGEVHIRRGRYKGANH